jgi:hypothetical protein
MPQQNDIIIVHLNDNCCHDDILGQIHQKFYFGPYVFMNRLMKIMCRLLPYDYVSCIYYKRN